MIDELSLKADHNKLHFGIDSPAKKEDALGTDCKYKLMDLLIFRGTKALFQFE